MTEILGEIRFLVRLKLQGISDQGGRGTLIINGGAGGALDYWGNLTDQPTY